MIFVTFALLIGLLIFAYLLLKKNIQLKNSIDKFEALLDSALEGIFIFDSSHKCVNMNTKGCEIFNIENKSKVIGLDIFEYIRDDYIPLIQQKMTTDYKDPYEVVLLRSNKEEYPALIKGKNAIIDGEKVRIVSVLDISDIKEKERMLFQQSKLAQMGEMISMIAHQWRQPLSAISATSAALGLKAQLNKADPELIQKHTKKISQYAQHLSSTIDDFRRFFQETKKKNILLVSELVNSTLTIIEPSIKGKDITLNVDIQNDVKIETYENEVKQVILNLLKNAEDVLIEKHIEFPTINIIVNKNIIKIQDNGGGISEDILEKIFEPYFSTKLKKDGTGLGLYMSKTIIESHCGGKLDVENSLEGACFTIVFDKNCIKD